MGKFLGMLSSDAYGAKVSEMKIGHYNIPAAKVVASVRLKRAMIDL